MSVGDFEVGDRVRTVKGCRITGPSTGVILRFGKWANYDAASILKDKDGSIRQYLVKNLRKLNAGD